ncbi:response regulator transcription factor [Desulfobacterales bacterium HSG16]|nr:response regulator transcription factor [Desulfobacterales bacterium HSG16]
MTKVLIVEDSPTFRKTFRDALSRRFPFLIIKEASNGREALDRIKSFDPALVFMDIRLAGESGLELTEKIKAENPEIIVIILTNYDLPEYRKAASDGGADDFIPKGALSLTKIEGLINGLPP